MLQVKSFSDMQSDNDFNAVNKWLEEMNEKIEIIDIKYGVSCYPPDDKAGWNTQYTSGVLILYKTILGGAK